MQSLLITLLVVCSALTGWKEYTNRKLHIKLNYPETWEPLDIDGGVSFLTPPENESDDFRENVTCTQVDLSNHLVTVDEFTELAVNGLKKKIGDSAVLSIKDITLGGERGKEVIYIKSGTPTAKVKQLVTTKKGIAYVFTYLAQPATYDKYDSLATETIFSLKILK